MCNKIHNGYSHDIKYILEGSSIEMHFHISSSKSFEKAIEDLKNALSSRNFGVLWELNFKDKLNEKGLDFDKRIEILEVCNPSQAKKLLDKNVEVSYFLPCKIVVYEEGDSVVIGMVKPTKIIELIDDDELLSIALEVEKVLMESMLEAK